MDFQPERYGAPSGALEPAVPCGKLEPAVPCGKTRRPESGVRRRFFLLRGWGDSGHRTPDSASDVWTGGDLGGACTPNITASCSALVRRRLRQRTAGSRNAPRRVPGTCDVGNASGANPARFFHHRTSHIQEDGNLSMDQKRTHLAGAHYFRVPPVQ
jgi:hypothetical protein